MEGLTKLPLVGVFQQIARQLLVFFFSLCAFEKTYVHSLLKKEKINFNRPPNQNENHWFKLGIDLDHKTR